MTTVTYKHTVWADISIIVFQYIYELLIDVENLTQ